MANEHRGDDSGFAEGWRGFFQEELSTAWSDGVLLANCFVTGLLDSAVFNVWSCFVSMQTGNTVYVGLGVSGQPDDQPWRWCKSLVAIVSFLGGAFVFTRAMRAAGEQLRSTIFVSSLIQAILTLVSAALGSSGVVSKNAGNELPQSFIVLLPLSLLSIQSGGQCVLSRVLGFTEVPTVVVTSAYCDIASDQKLFSLPLADNPKRNRRIMSVVLLLLGAITGGFLTSDGDINLALWTTGIIKTVIATVWLFWKSEGAIQLE